MSLNSNPKLESCIEACQRCAITCEHCSTACLNEDDVKMMVPCIMLDRSCAEMCALAAREMARGSMFANQTCRLCAEICQACGDECSKHQMDHCQECAEVCKECATACREMAA